MNFHGNSPNSIFFIQQKKIIMQRSKKCDILQQFYFPQVSKSAGDSNLIQFYKMQNRPPVIMNKQSVNAFQQKYKFWDTAQAGNQRSPKNMSLVIASQAKVQQTKEQRRQQMQHQQNRVDSQQSGSKSESEQEPSQLNSHEEKLKQLEEQSQRLRGEIEEGRLLNQNLLKQLNKTTNDLRVAESLNTELNQECDRLYLSVKMAYDKQSEVTNQKMDLLIQISALNQTKQLAVNKAEIMEEQTQYLNKKIESLYEQISFQKSITLDMTKETLVLKQQLNKMMTMMRDYSQLQQQVAKTHVINNQIQDKVRRLEDELKNTRIQVEQSERNQEIYRQEQNKLFLRIEQLQNQKNILSQKLYFAQAQLGYRLEEELSMKNQHNESVPRYNKILQQLEKKNSDLVFEVLALNQRNHKLVQERDFYMRRVEATLTNRAERLPYDQFVSILKATNDQVNLLKKKLQVKQDQLQHIRNQTDTEVHNLQQKIKQLNNVIEIRNRQRQNQRNLIENQIQIYKKECDLIRKRNQQLKNNQVKLRLQIIEKDRIIVEFVERNKKAQII